MARKIKIPATKYPVERFALDNGLRVVLTPDRSAPVHSAALAAATREQVAEVAARYLAPAKAVTVVLGDADRIEAPLAALTSVERSAA